MQKVHCADTVISSTAKNMIFESEEINKEASSLLFEQFEKQCAVTPGNTALIFNDTEQTYQELNRKIMALAYHLQQLKVQKNTLVAILLPKSDYQVIAALGILKAGAAYMPINMSESPERQQTLLEKGQVSVVLTLGDSIAKHPWLANFAVVVLDQFLTDAQSQPSQLLSTMTQAKDLAYVVFTSGSTGAPKGVMINHANAVNTINDINERFNVTEQDRVLALSALDFDLSVYDIFGPLSVGAAVVIPTQEQCVEPREWLRLVEKHSVSIWDSVPGFMEMMVRYIQLKSREIKSSYTVSSLRLTMLSGDWIRVQLPNEICQCFPNTQVMSLGGATEASIWSIVFPINQVDSQWKSIPYGKPLKNQTFYVLDAQQIVVNDGQEGELYIGGKGVGQGYWQDPENTLYHFINHQTFGYLYRTGDKGRRMADGNIEFLGRVGEQIKLRGFRLDVKAIETCIEGLPEVERCLAKIIKTNKATESLVAFVKCENFVDYLLGHYQVYKKIISRHLCYWQAIYDGLLENSEEPEDPAFNTIGWVSSYSQKCIPSYQMKEWLDNTLTRLKVLQPKRVLEVGVGTGMLLAALAPKVERYDATDTSNVAITNLKKYFSKEAYQHVNYFNGELSTLLLKKTYDTVILNSVVQYFPDILYLTKTLDQLVDRVEPGGQVFLGDIYHYDYIEDFHVSVQLQHQSPEMKLSEFQALISRLVSKEGELFIHPQLFMDYAKRHKRINQVNIQLKPGLSHNELNGFRYDVVLGVEKLCVEVNQSTVKQFSELSTIESIGDYLSSEQPENLIVKSIPNLRVIGLSVYSSFRDKINSQIKSLREAVYQHGFAALDPHYCYELGKKLGYQVSCVWSEKKHAFDVAFYITNNPLQSYCNETEEKESYYFNYSNMPLLRQFQNKVEEELKQHASQHLASYMQPHEIIFLDEIPFTANGKVNHKELEKLTLSASQSYEGKCLEPINDTQEKLLSIFKQVLRLRIVDIHKGFIQLGGDSLMMLETTYAIEKQFGINLTLGELIAHPSVHELSLFLSAKVALAQEVSA
jgi:amino acid adenylation domain-containing protein